jgi:hypothetical protein
MKTRNTFLLIGLIGGLVCVIPGPLLSIFTLTWSVGPVFFIAVVAGIITTGARHQLQDGYFRYLAGFVVCFVTYLLALTIFFGVYGFSPDWFGVRPSQSVDQFGIDVWLGLLVAGAFASGGIAFFGFVLTGWWSNYLVLRLLMAGIVTIVVTFMVNFPFHNYWSFFGVLISLGSSLFCGAVGGHIWQHLELGRHIGETAPPSLV